MEKQLVKEPVYDAYGNLQISPLYWCASNVCVNGKPMQLLNRGYMHDLYSEDFTQMILFTGRQVGKSLYLATQHLIKLALMAPFSSIYVAPRFNQVKDWSNDKLKHIMENSPNLQYLVPANKKGAVWNVKDKQLTNGSVFKGRSAFLNPDAVRGISGDMLCYDKRAMYLTETNGWVGVDEIGREDRIATLSATGEIEYQYPKRLYEFESNGRMIRFKNDSMDIRVTPNHRMYTKLNNIVRVVEADQLVTKESFSFLTKDDYEIKFDEHGNCAYYEEWTEKEPVYCVTVPNGILLVKGTKDSQPIWCGNSLDEIQDQLSDNIPVLQECLSYRDEDEPKKKYQMYSGTPKTSSHAIDAYWEKSDKREWAVQCRGVGHCFTWNILGYDNIGKKELVCVNCGKAINPENGRWVITNPGARWVGFRIPQIMTPWTPIYNPDSGVDDIKTKQRDYPIAKFMNECLAITYDEGTKPVTQAEVFSCCDENLSHIHRPNKHIMNSQIFAGLDWGQGSGEHPSYTVLTLGVYWHPEVLTIFYIKKFTGTDSDIKSQPAKILDILRRFNVKLIAADWGFGAYQNKILIEKYGAQRVMEIQYVSGAKDKLRFNNAAERMMGDRTMLLQDFFRDIQRQKFRFFKVSEFKQYAEDIFNIYTDYNEKRQIIKYDHSPSQPDDVAHSINYCSIAAKFFTHRLKK